MELVRRDASYLQRTDTDGNTVDDVQAAVQKIILFVEMWQEKLESIFGVDGRISFQETLVDLTPQVAPSSNPNQNETLTSQASMAALADRNTGTIIGCYKFNQR